MTEAHSDTTVTFASLGLVDAGHGGHTAAGFVNCTPIQAQTLPIALAGRDVAGQAQTGTGKTAAFLVALYQSLLTHPAAAGNRAPTSVRALIVAPTRELAVQIHHDALVLGRHTGLKHRGRLRRHRLREAARAARSDGVDVLIGTPGRLIDYFKQHVFDLRHAQVLVLDEADRMFDLGFIADIRYILRRLPPPDRRQSMLFSATLSQRVLELAYEHMNNPELVRIEPDKMTVDRVRQMMYFPSMEEKVPLLIGLLRQIEAAPHHGVRQHQAHGRAPREHRCNANGFNAQALSGDVPQNKRLRFLREFHDGELAVLIATDVASRGLHIPDVSHVFNFDLPQDRGRLRAPHRPHGARRRRRRCHQLRLRGVRGLAAGHRDLHRPQDPLLPDRARAARHGRGRGSSDSASPARRWSPRRRRRATREPGWRRRARPQGCPARALAAPRPRPLTVALTRPARLSSPPWRPPPTAPGRPSPSAENHGPSRMAEIEDNVDRELFRNIEKLRQLRIEHRDLDEVICRLSLDLHIDELQLKRLKKRKLMLKDQITRLESQLIPDLNA